MTDSLSAIHHLVDDAAREPGSELDHIYRSATGDLWQLVRDTSTGRILVRHTSNAPSGCAVSDTSVEEFLALNASGPEHGALRLLLGKRAPA